MMFISNRTMVAIWTYVLLWLLFQIWAIATPAWSHDWYDPACCSGHDCAPIPESAVTWTESGWRVELRPGDHFMVQSHAVLETVPFDEVLPSQDDQWHACLRSEVAPAERIICLYIPEGQFGS